MKWVNFRILNIKKNFKIDESQLIQITNMTKKLCFSAFILAVPRLMEPYSFDCVKLVVNILKNRRSIFLYDTGNPGTLYYVIIAVVPIIESLGLEVDLKFHTQGQVFVQFFFNDWRIVKGDPLVGGTGIFSSSKKSELVKKFITITRKRKGLHEYINIQNFFDDSMIINLLIKNN